MSARVWLVSMLLTAVAAVAHGAADTDFAITVSGRFYYVATTGADTNPGTKASPLRTISKGAELAQPSDAVLVYGGIYRERVSPPRGGSDATNPIIYKAQPGQNVIIKGSEAWRPTWTQSGAAADIQFAVPGDALFNDDVYVTNKNPFKVAVASTPYGRDGKPEFATGNSAADANMVYTLGQVFVDGAMYVQKPYQSEMAATAGTWWYDGATGRIYVHFISAGLQNTALVEITTRRRIFAPHTRGLGYIQVLGFVMEHCGNQFPRHFWDNTDTAQAGALGTRSGHHWTIRGNLVRYATSIGMDFGGESNVDNERTNQPRPTSSLLGYHLIDGNRVSDNGSAGMMSYISTSIQVRANVIERNNNLRFIGNNRFEQGGIKLHACKDGVVSGNLVRGNYAPGIYFDGGTSGPAGYSGARVTANAVLNNQEYGIFMELGAFDSEAVVIDDNVVVGNGGTAIYVSDTSGITTVHNLLANTPAYTFLKGTGLTIRWDSTRGNTAHTRNCALLNSLVLGNTVDLDINYPSALAGGRSFTNNFIAAAAGDRSFYVNPYGTVPAPAEATFYATVNTDLGAQSPGTAVFGSNLRAKLTFAEWKAFWAAKGFVGDAGSAIGTGSVTLNGLDLTVTVPGNALNIGSTNHARMDVDFLGAAVPQNGAAKPGPFQNLIAGANTIRLWNGVTPLAAGELPATVTNITPTAAAGPDQAITLPAGVSLPGIVADSDHSPYPLTAAWSKQSGPGSVTFANATAAATSATFSAAGTYVLALTASDGALSAVDTATITVNPAPDTAPPATPAAPTTNSATSATPTLSGTTEANATVRVYDNGTQIGSVTAAGNGAWSFVVTTPLAFGTHATTVTAADAAGNISAASPATTITVVGGADTTPPATPAAPTTSSTTSASPTFNGTTEANATVRIYDGATLLGSVTATGSGAWSFTVTTPLSSGSHAVSVRAVDAAGNVSAASATTTITVADSTPPAPPAAPTTSSTTSPTPVFSGTTEPGATVRIYDGATLIGMVVATSVGSWSFTVTIALVAGTHAITVTTTDASNNASSASPVTTIVIAGPVLRVLSPNGGERVGSGSAQAVTWQGDGFGFIRVRLSLDRGASWSTLSRVADSGSTTVALPAVATDTAALIAVTTDSGSPVDQSDAIFVIVASGSASSPSTPTQTGTVPSASAQSGGGCGLGSGLGLLLLIGCALLLRARLR